FVVALAFGLAGSLFVCYQTLVYPCIALLVTLGVANLFFGVVHALQYAKLRERYPRMHLRPTIAVFGVIASLVLLTFFGIEDGTYLHQRTTDLQGTSFEYRGSGFLTGRVISARRVDDQTMMVELAGQSTTLGSFSVRAPRGDSSDGSPKFSDRDLAIMPRDSVLIRFTTEDQDRATGIFPFGEIHGGQDGTNGTCFLVPNDSDAREAIRFCRLATGV
ncbi:MAG: hypothetical protein KDD44_12665, partial [Bdellovibrionales bacterium]|nr:hypothetical protein [Bdellovibrionales bacterium]